MVMMMNKGKRSALHNKPVRDEQHKRQRERERTLSGSHNKQSSSPLQPPITMTPFHEPEPVILHRQYVVYRLLSLRIEQIGK